MGLRRLLIWITSIILLSSVSFSQTLPIPLGTGHVTSSAFQTETTTFLNAITTAGGSFTIAQQDSIDRFFKDIKGISNPRYTTYNKLSSINIIYPFLTGVSATDKINMVNPGTYNYTETGSPTYSTSTKSVALNGTSQYLNTTHTPNGSATFGSSDFTGMAVHRIDANSDGNATIGEIGGGNSYMQIISASTKIMVLSAQTANSGSNSQLTARLWWESWSSSSNLNCYYNATLIASTSTTFGNTPTRSILIGAFNAATPGFGGASTVDFYIEVVGSWSDNEEAFMYNATKALAASFGKTWN